ncbi:MAG: hypothetical protein RRY07_10710, partial [Bacteroidaceae bacterium]
MKKKYLFFTLALALLGGGSQPLKAQANAKYVSKIGAAITSMAALDGLDGIGTSGATVLIQNKNTNVGGMYLQQTGTNDELVYATKPSKKREQAKFVWLVKKTTNGNIATYSFQNLLTSGFLPVPIDNNTPVKTVNNTAQNKGAFSIECKSSAFYITQNNNTTKDNYGFNGHGSTFLFWTPGSAAGDPSHAIAFYPCTVSEGVLYTVTTKMREENSTTEFETRTEEMLSGEIYNAPAVDLKKVVSTDPANVNGTVLNLTTDKTIIAYYKYDPTKLPFTTTTVANNAFAPVTKWYNFRLNTNETQGYCLYDDVTKEILSNKGQANVQGVAAGLFAFAGDPINGFDIYNKSTGTASKLGDRITDHASMVAAESGIKWYLVRNDEPGWNLSKLKTPSGNCYLNRRTSYVGYYNSTSDNGSRCGFEINTYDITINATGYATFSADV